MHSKMRTTNLIGVFSLSISFTSSGQLPVSPLSMYPGETLFALANPTHSTASDLPIYCWKVNFNEILSGLTHTYELHQLSRYCTPSGYVVH